MTESNTMSKPTVAETLLEACREIASTGQTVKRATLMDMRPNHSARDYQKALELFADECRKVRDCPVPMPEEMLERINNIMKSLWADIVRSSENRIARIRDESQKLITEARYARDKVTDDMEKLKEQMKAKDLEIGRLSNLLTASKQVEEKQNALMQQLQSELTACNAKFDTLQTSFNKLTEWKEKSEQTS